MVRIAELLSLIAGTRSPGPSPLFSPIHILKVILLIRDNGPIGRSRLAILTGLGEGSVKTIINRLRAANIVSSTRRGVVLTGNGVRLGLLLKRLLPKAAFLPRIPITLGRYNYALLVKGMAEMVKIGLEQRDEAVRMGALGATTIIKRGCELIMPPSLKLSEEYPETSRLLLEIFNPEDRDVIIIGCADTPLLAEYGTLSAALTLIGSIELETPQNIR